MNAPASFGPIEVELRDHRHVRMREMRPDDRDEIRQAFGRLSNDSRYTRFMYSVRELSPRMLEDVLHRRTERELGLVAEIDAPDGIDIVGGARYHLHPDGESCEFAITVTDDWARVGLASRLMHELIQGARARGVKHMEGFVLAANSRMLTLARRLGFSVSSDPDDAMVKIVRLDLTRWATKKR